MILALQYDFGKEILISIVCILVVYAMLYLLTLCVRPLKFLKDKPEKIEEDDALLEEKKTFGIEDITDEDMMVAALIAAIDCRETSHTDVQVKSIKEIK
jgi:hypothetical protein